MTDTKLPPCILCNANPDIGHITGLVFHPVNDCPSFSAHAFTPDQWRQLHGPAQALMEIDQCFEAALVEGWIEALADGDVDRIRDIWQRRISYARDIAIQQLSGRE